MASLIDSKPVVDPISSERSFRADGTAMLSFTPSEKECIDKLLELDKVLDALTIDLGKKESFNLKELQLLSANRLKDLDEMERSLTTFVKTRIRSGEIDPEKLKKQLERIEVLSSAKEYITQHFYGLKSALETILKGALNEEAGKSVFPKISHLFVAKKTHDLFRQIIMGKHKHIGDELGKGAYGSVRNFSVGKDGSYAIKRFLFPPRGSVEKEVAVMSATSSIGSKSRVIMSPLLVSTEIEAQYIVMEKALFDLSTLIGLPLDVRTDELISEIGYTVFEGISDLLKLGILHSDLKLQNLLMLPDGSFKIADMGLSMISGQIASGGTFGYQAPETFREVERAGANELWSLGVILLQLGCDLGEKSLPEHLFETYKKETLVGGLGALLKYMCLDIKQEHVDEFLLSLQKDGRRSDVFFDLVTSLLQVNPTDRPNLEELAEFSFLSMGKEIVDEGIYPGKNKEIIEVLKAIQKEKKVEFEEGFKERSSSLVLPLPAEREEPFYLGSKDEEYYSTYDSSQRTDSIDFDERSSKELGGFEESKGSDGFMERSYIDDSGYLADTE